MKAVAESDAQSQPRGTARPVTMAETCRPISMNPTQRPVLSPAEVQDDRGQITSGDKVLLIIEDDPKYIPSWSSSPTNGDSNAWPPREEKRG